MPKYYEKSKTYQSPYEKLENGLWRDKRTDAVGVLKVGRGGGFYVDPNAEKPMGKRESKYKEEKLRAVEGYRREIKFNEDSYFRTSNRKKQHDLAFDNELYRKEAKRFVKEFEEYDNPRESRADLSKLEGKHIAGREAKAREIDKINKGDTYVNKMGTRVDIMDIDDKGQTVHKFTRADGSTDYKTYNKSDVESMLKHNEYVKTDSTGTLASNKEDQKTVNAGYLKSTNIAKEMPKNLRISEGDLTDNDKAVLNETFKEFNVKEGNPVESMAKERVHEVKETLNNDKILLNYAKRKKLNGIDGTSIKELEERIAKKENYINTAEGKQTDSNGFSIDKEVRNLVKQNYGEIDMNDLYDEELDAITKVAQDNIKEMKATQKASTTPTEKWTDTDKYEYDLYKRAKENPDSIDPMTEWSTDWEELDKKWSNRYDYDKEQEEFKTEAQVERFKERKGSATKTDNGVKETYTKSGKINYKAFGIERTPENDFTDDGTRFSSYMLSNGMKMTVAKANDETYMSVRTPYDKEISYQEYSNLPHYKDLDMYNGTSGKVDLNKLVESANAYMNEYNELKKQKGLPVDERSVYQRRLDNMESAIKMANESYDYHYNYYKNHPEEYSGWRRHDNEARKAKNKAYKLAQKREKFISENEKIEAQVERFKERKNK